MNYAVVLCFLVAATTVTSNPEWENFKAEYGRLYRNPTEEAFRMKIFLDNKMTIDQHNQRYAEGKSTFTMGINQFSDLTNLEYNELLNYRAPPTNPSEDIQSFNSSDVSIPTTVDWRTSGCVAPVKDQKQCGSCWAFSAVGSAEFYNCRAKKSLVKLSEQELVDCSSSYGNGGCKGGGWMTDAFRYMVDNGISCEACYPYKAVVGLCRPCTNCAKFRTYYPVQPAGSESALTTAVANVGVISVAIDAGRPTFQNYKTGIYNDGTCTKTVNHAVVVIGYGADGGIQYYLVKNSWGTVWGMQGYIKMTRNGSNQCCIACYASYPVV